MTIGKQIQLVRKEKKITQQQLADMIGVKRAAISKYEKDLVDVPYSKLVAIADALDMSITEFMLQGSLNQSFSITHFTDEVERIGKKQALNLSASKVELLEKIEELANMPDKPEIELNFDYKQSNQDIQQKQQLLNSYEKLNKNGKKEAVKRVNELSFNPEYTTPDEE